MRKTILAAVFAAMLGTGAIARDTPPELQLDVDFFDNLVTVRPYCGSNWIERYFADRAAQGVKRVVWRCHAQIANYPSALNYNLAEVQKIRSAADERRFSGAFAAKVGVGRLKPGKESGGIRQRIENGTTREFILRGMVSSDPLPSGAFLAAVDAESGRTIARSAEAGSFDMERLEVRFRASGPFYAGVFSRGGDAPDGIHVFVTDAMSLRDAANPDAELLANGGMEDVDEFMEPRGWEQDGALFVTLNGDVTAIPEKTRKEKFDALNLFSLINKPLRDNSDRVLRASEDGNSLVLAAAAAKRNGIAFYAWYDPIDDGRKCLPPVKVWADRFMESHPEFRCTDKNGRARWGLLCFACPEVRAHKTAVVRELLAIDGVTGVAFKTHYQHNLLWGMKGGEYADCLYHPAILERYNARWERPADGAYSHSRLRILHGEAFMEWMRELRPIFKECGKKLCMFQAPGAFLGRRQSSGWYLPASRIIEDRLCDEFLIEPRWRGDHLERFAKSPVVNRIVSDCRKYGVKVGFDFYFACMDAERDQKKRGDFLVGQVGGLAKEDLDFIGVYEDICLEKIRPRIADAARAAAGAPAVATVRTPPESAKAGVISPETCGDVFMDDGTNGVSCVTEVVYGEDDWDGVYAKSGAATLTVPFNKTMEISEVRLYSGHLHWRQVCAVEDFAVEGLSGGAWKALGEIKDANAAKGKDQNVPNVCRFDRQPLEGLRIKITRCVFPPCTVIRAVQAK